MKKLGFIFSILLIIGLVVAYYGYQMIFSPNVEENETSFEIYIPSESGYNDVKQILLSNNIIKKEFSFDQVAKLMKYDNDKVPSGKYIIAPNLSNKELISLLRSGNQSPIKITFNNLRTSVDLAGRIASYLEVDSVNFSKTLHNDETMVSLGSTKEELLTHFIPNTYEAYWNDSPEKIISKLKGETEKWWSQNNRSEKAQKLGMTRAEVYTLASIVEKESIRNDEKPIIAGVYLNRIKAGIPLQADPTVVFAMQKFDLRRVLNKHLEYESPYNTYKYAGLPPGPIYMPSIASLDAVLNYKRHKYLYFCAKPESNGGHLFAESLSQHNANARIYHRWLDRQGIR